MQYASVEYPYDIMMILISHLDMIVQIKCFFSPPVAELWCIK